MSKKKRKTKPFHQSNNYHQEVRGCKYFSLTAKMSQMEVFIITKNEYG